MSPPQIADTILVIHTLFVIGVILPVPLFIIGKFRNWNWVRLNWVRNTHLCMIGFVVLETIAGQMCPLTLWENSLRLSAGETGYGDGFISHWIHQWLFYSFPKWVFLAAYTGFGLLVFTLYVWVPPRWLQKRFNA